MTGTTIENFCLDDLDASLSRLWNPFTCYTHLIPFLRPRLARGQVVGEMVTTTSQNLQLSFSTQLELFLIDKNSPTTLDVRWGSSRKLVCQGLSIRSLLCEQSTGGVQTHTPSCWKCWLREVGSLTIFLTGGDWTVRPFDNFEKASSLHLLTVLPSNSSQSKPS